MSSSWKEGGEAPPASVISGGSGKSTRVPLSARSSLTSVVSIHPSSYAYLNDRVYNPLDAKSEWLRRVRNELKGKESERNLLKVVTQELGYSYWVVVKTVDIYT